MGHVLSSLPRLLEPSERQKPSRARAVSASEIVEPLKLWEVERPYGRRQMEAEPAHSWLSARGRRVREATQTLKLPRPFSHQRRYQRRHPSQGSCLCPAASVSPPSPGSDSPGCMRDETGPGGLQGSSVATTWRHRLGAFLSVSVCLSVSPSRVRRCDSSSGSWVQHRLHSVSDSRHPLGCPCGGLGPCVPF